MIDDRQFNSQKWPLTMSQNGAYSAYLSGIMIGESGSSNCFCCYCCCRCCCFDKEDDDKHP